MFDDRTMACGASSLVTEKVKQYSTRLFNRFNEHGGGRGGGLLVVVVVGGGATNIVIHHGSTSQPTYTMVGVSCWWWAIMVGGKCLVRSILAGWTCVWLEWPLL